ncbi:hypothetical protein CFP56_020958 [Quercus suber]|uniref:Leucine-rich repeat-containing N-terminal plant-type domain-containing protein n=1 Tax=Quercus suber TaxID=58331 RepID=A0AAW0LYT5_QUESU
MIMKIACQRPWKITRHCKAVVEKRVTTIVDYCNGLVCLRNCDEEIALGNPLIRKYKKLPSGSPLQFLLTFILLLLCMKPTTGNNLGLADTHLVCKEHERQALLKIKQDLIDDYGHLSSWNSNQDYCK